MNGLERQRTNDAFLYRVSVSFEIANDPRRKNKWCPEEDSNRRGIKRRKTVLLSLSA
jgi:hypothetical protein